MRSERETAAEPQISFSANSAHSSSQSPCPQTDFLESGGRGSRSSQARGGSLQLLTELPRNPQGGGREQKCQGRCSYLQKPHVPDAAGRFQFYTLGALTQDLPPPRALPHPQPPQTPCSLPPVPRRRIKHHPDKRREGSIAVITTTVNKIQQSHFHFKTPLMGHSSFHHPESLYILRGDATVPPAPDIHLDSGGGGGLGLECRAQGGSPAVWLYLDPESSTHQKKKKRPRTPSPNSPALLRNRQLQKSIKI